MLMKYNFPHITEKEEQVLFMTLFIDFTFNMRPIGTLSMCVPFTQNEAGNESELRSILL